MDRLYNCHTHIFNIDHSPERFLEVATSKRMAKIARYIMQLPVIRKYVAKWFLNIKNPIVSKYASFILIGTGKSQNHVYRDLRKDYSDQDRFVVLTLNMDYQGAGDPPSNYAQQIYEIKRVKRNNPDSCLPFYSVDPRAGSNRENAAAARDHIVNKGFAGIKIYPALGFYPFDKNLQSTYKFAKDNNVPVMTHCTRVGSYYLGELTPEMKHPKSNFCDPPPRERWPENFPILKFPIENDLDDNAAFCDNFSYPYNYAWVLDHKVERKRNNKKYVEEYKSLKICFAHAGDDPEIVKGRFITKKLEKDPEVKGNTKNKIKEWISKEIKEETREKIIKEIEEKIKDVADEKIKKWVNKWIEEYNSSWFTHIKHLIKTYDNVYTDISFTLSENTIFDDLYAFISDPDYSDRILFGTDFYMTMMKKKEKPLVEDFRKFLFSKKNGPDLWRAITVDNPKTYLSSTFYTPT